MEHFYTLQGEGAFSGRAAYFIRLGGCDVGCTWCDVKESWNMENHPKIEIQNLIQEAEKSGSGLAVITGGEPLMHDISALTTSLQQKNIRVHIETSGTYPLTGKPDWVCLSPKKFRPPLSSFPGLADELKIIVFNSSDFEWAEKYSSLVKSDCRLFLQPEWEKASEMLPKIVDYVKANPRWEISLQVHKYLNIP